MTTHAFCDSCLLEKNCYADELWQQTFLQILHHVWTPKRELKMDPKMVPEFDPQNGVQKWHPKMGSKNGTPKWGPKMAPKRGPNISIKKKSRLYLHFNTFFGCHFWTPFWGAIFGPHFGVPFLDPILVVKFWHHFWVHFQLPFWGPKHGAKFAQMFAAKAHLHSNFFSSKHESQNACVVIA